MIIEYNLVIIFFSVSTVDEYIGIKLLNESELELRTILSLKHYLLEMPSN